jgi:hypothetical protein
MTGWKLATFLLVFPIGIWLFMPNIIASFQASRKATNTNNGTDLNSTQTNPDNQTWNQTMTALAQNVGQIAVWIPIIAVAGVIISAIAGFSGWFANGSEVVYEQPTRETEDEEPSDPEEPHLNVPEPKTPVFEYKCPHCAAPIEFDYGETRTKCAYCGSRVHRTRELAEDD